MLFFGLSFILYVLQLSGRNGFWKNLRKTDITTHKSAISYQKILQKYVIANLDIEFLRKCKSIDVYPKFVRWKNKTRKKIINFRKLTLMMPSKKNLHKKKQQLIDELRLV